MQIDLKGKTAVVTGASGELGRVIARTLADCGANIAIAYHSNEQKADKLRKEVTGKGVRAMAVKGDVTSEASLMAMHAAIEKELGSPDVVVNNAVIASGSPSPVQPPSRFSP